MHKKSSHMQDKIYTNLLRVGIMQLYKTSEREHAKVRHDDIYILTTEKTRCLHVH